MRDWLRHQLTKAGEAADLLAGDHAISPDDALEKAALAGWRPKHDGRQASVLIPLVDRRDETTVLLTRRTDHLPDHAGQVAFPGGSREPQDEDAIATALREAEEEVGLPPSHVEVLASLDLYKTGTGFHITPVVGLVDPRFTVRPDPQEVAAVFEVPLEYFLDPRNHTTQTRQWKGIDRTFYAMTWEDHFIWGATAAMLVNLSRVLGQPPSTLLTGSTPILSDEG